MAWNDLTNPEAWKLALANLLRKGEDVGTYISEAPEKAGKAILEAGQRQSALMDKAFDPTGKTLIRDPQAANQAAMNLLEGPLGFMPAGITAWHGSPAKFDKFDISKVDTGEGAQFYGHGMYFAEHPSVAEPYMKNLGEYVQTVNGEVVDSPVVKSIIRSGGNPETFIKSLQNKIEKQTKVLETANKEEVLPGLSDYDIAKIDLNSTLKMIDEAKSYIGKSLRSEPVGNLYKVDIPDEYIPKMLNWDNPLSEQSKSVQDMVWKYKDALINKTKITGDKSIWDLTGADLYGVMQRYSVNDAGKLVKKNVNAKDLSNMLNQSDIKGIQYMNYQGKASEGANTPNYVVFDPTDVKILERNNQPVSRKELIEEQVKKLK